MAETFEEFKKRLLQNPEIRKEYEALKPEFRAKREEIIRKIWKRVKECGLPSKEKIEWLVKNTPSSELRTMLKDFWEAVVIAYASSNASSNPEILRYEIEDWEATIEALNNPELMKALKSKKHEYTRI